MAQVNALIKYYLIRIELLRKWQRQPNSEKLQNHRESKKVNAEV
jgi:hypothetical protein